MNEATPATPYANLTPDAILTAVESAGWLTDGRLLALNSYENRVYQVGIEDAPPLVAKFYRPGRWSDAAILEEHAFSRELTDAEIPVVAPLADNGATLLHHADYRFALFPVRAVVRPIWNVPTSSNGWAGSSAASTLSVPPVVFSIVRRLTSKRSGARHANLF